MITLRILRPPAARRHGRGGTVELGYGPEVLLRFPEPFIAEPVHALDVKRLPAYVKLLAGGSGQ
jgi:hypothetical protein